MAKIDLHPKALAQPITVAQACPEIISFIYNCGIMNPTRIVSAKLKPFQTFGTSPSAGNGHAGKVITTASNGAEWPTIPQIKRGHSFPDRFQMSGTFARQWRQIGNSVPPLFMYHIALRIKHVLFNGQYIDRFKCMDYPAILEAAWQQHLAPRDDNAPTVISTFAGGGGSSLGYSMAGYRELLAVEWDDNAVETFKLNFPDVPVYHGDIAKLSVDEVLERTSLQPGELDVFDGSPPCQGFSTAGKRVLDDDRNQLFKEFVRLLRGLRPKVFVMENVSGMVKGKMKLVFAEILRDLKASGYQVSARLMNAKYFHVPQSRQRLIFIGVRDDLAIVPSHPAAQSKPVTVGDAFEGVIDEPADGVILGVESKTYRDAMTLKAGETHPKHFSIHKLPINKPAPTIIRGGGAAAYLYWHPLEMRPITTHEVKRLGAFPDSYMMAGTISDIFTRIGNSVPPLMMRAIARHIRENILSP